MSQRERAREARRLAVYQRDEQQVVPQQQPAVPAPQVPQQQQAPQTVSTPQSQPNQVLFQGMSQRERAREARRLAVYQRDEQQVVPQQQPTVLAPQVPQQQPTVPAPQVPQQQPESFTLNHNGEHLSDDEKPEINRPVSLQNVSLRPVIPSQSTAKITRRSDLQNLGTETLQQEQQINQIQSSTAILASSETSQKGNINSLNQSPSNMDQQGKRSNDYENLHSSPVPVPVSSFPDVEFPKPDTLLQNVYGNGALSTKQNPLPEQSSVNATITTATGEVKNSVTDDQGNGANNDYNGPREISPIKTETKNPSDVLSQQNSLSDERNGEEEEEEEKEEEEQYEDGNNYPRELSDLYNSTMAPLNDWQEAAGNFWKNPNNKQAKKDEEDARKCSTEALSKITLDRINELEQKYGRDSLDRLANEMQGTLDDPENDFQDETRMFLGNFRDRLQKQEGAFERADFLLCPVAVSGKEGTGDNQRGASEPATPIRLKKSATPEAKTPRRSKEAQLPILTGYYFIQDLNVIQKCGRDLLVLKPKEKAQFFVGNPEGQKHRETLLNTVLAPKTKEEKTVKNRFLKAMSDDAITKLWNEQGAKGAKSDKDKKEWENKKKRQASLTERKVKLRNEYKEAKNPDQDPSDEELLVWLLGRFASEEMTDAMMRMPTLNQQINKEKPTADQQQQTVPIGPVVRAFLLNDDMNQTKELSTATKSNQGSEDATEGDEDQDENRDLSNNGSDPSNSNHEDSSDDKFNQNDTGKQNRRRHKKHHEPPTEQGDPNDQTLKNSENPTQDKIEGKGIQTNGITAIEGTPTIPDDQKTQEVSSDLNASGNPLKHKNIFTTSFADLVKEQQRREEEETQRQQKVFTILKACNFLKSLKTFPKRAKDLDLCRQDHKNIFLGVLEQKNVLQAISNNQLSGHQKKEKDDMERKLSCLTQEQFNEMSSESTSNKQEKKKEQLSRLADKNLLRTVSEYLTSTTVDAIRADLASYEKWKEDRRENAQQSRRSNNSNSSSPNNE
ncbi:MAG: hypothetical protein LW808_002380 [Verrucomicrobiota bacterium]|nr:MAG: hypothetical protein LW808_002380 [Verrucomicrobiota bacterium]